MGDKGSELRGSVHNQGAIRSQVDDPYADRMEEDQPLQLPVEIWERIVHWALTGPLLPSGCGFFPPDFALDWQLAAEAHGVLHHPMSMTVLSRKDDYRVRDARRARRSAVLALSRTSRSLSALCKPLLEQVLSLPESPLFVLSAKAPHPNTLTVVRLSRALLLEVDTPKILVIDYIKSGIFHQCPRITALSLARGSEFAGELIEALGPLQLKELRFKYTEDGHQEHGFWYTLAKCSNLLELEIEGAYDYADESWYADGEEWMEVHPPGELIQVGYPPPLSQRGMPMLWAASCLNSLRSLTLLGMDLWDLLDEADMATTVYDDNDELERPDPDPISDLSHFLDIRWQGIALKRLVFHDMLSFDSEDMCRLARNFHDTLEELWTEGKHEYGNESDFESKWSIYRPAFVREDAPDPDAVDDLHRPVTFSRLRTISTLYRFNKFSSGQPVSHPRQLMADIVANAPALVRLDLSRQILGRPEFVILRAVLERRDTLKQFKLVVLGSPGNENLMEEYEALKEQCRARGVQHQFSARFGQLDRLSKMSSDPRYQD